jgi:hypothetical protein
MVEGVILSAHGTSVAFEEVKVNSFRACRMDTIFN